MSYNVPGDFKADDDGFLNGKSSDADVYLIRVPKGFDISKLHGTEFSPSEIQELEVEEDGKQLTSVYELGVFSGQCLDVAPVMKSKDKTFLGRPLSGLLTVSKTVRVNPQSSQTTPKVKLPGSVPMPEGLRARFTPFGSGTPVAHSSKAAKKKKRKRKHQEIESPAESSGSTQKRKRRKYEDSVIDSQDSTERHSHKRHKHEDSVNGSQDSTKGHSRKRHKHEDSINDSQDSTERHNRKLHRHEDSINDSHDSTKGHRHKKKHKRDQGKSPGKS